MKSHKTKKKLRAKLTLTNTAQTIFSTEENKDILNKVLKCSSLNTLKPELSSSHCKLKMNR